MTTYRIAYHPASGKYRLEVAHGWWSREWLAVDSQTFDTRVEARVHQLHLEAVAHAGADAWVGI